MRTFAVTLFALALYAQPAANPYAPLWEYAGTWQITASNAAPGSKPETLVNQCAELGKFFACGQTINGAPEGLVAFVAGAQPGQYKTQTIRPDGRAEGVVQLEIKGSQWIYTSRRDEYGKTTLYRNTNTFTGKNHIHYEQAISSNGGTQWAVQGSGEEVRVGPPVHASR